jgi:hypothetical protein
LKTVGKIFFLFGYHFFQGFLAVIDYGYLGAACGTRPVADMGASTNIAGNVLPGPPARAALFYKIGRYKFGIKRLSVFHYFIGTKRTDQFE